MSKLVEYVMTHAVRGACNCGRCIDAPTNPKEEQPTGHVVDLTFFKVAASGGDKEKLLELVKDEYPHYLDGKEHGYMEIGAELGDQGTALMLIGLGHVLGAWRALSPDTMMPKLATELKQQMAGTGMVAMRTKNV